MHRKFLLLLFLFVATCGCMTDGTTPATSQATDDGQGEVQDTPEFTETTDVHATSDPADAATDAATDSSEEIVIDVRTKGEWDAGHVATAKHIPHDEIAERISEVTSDKNAKIVVYCKSGGRSGRAKTALEEMGFTNVENAGGYEEIKDRFAE